MKKIAIIIAAILSFFILLIIFPRQIYDEFLWRYFIGPVIADALNHPVEYHGIVAREGYSIISEIFYGIGLLAAIYGLYLLFEKLHLKINAKFFLSTFPFILLGSFGRVMEDANLLKPPLSYFFISPLIYFQIGIYFSIALAFGIIWKKEKWFIWLVSIIDALYSIFYIFFGSLFKYAIHPIIFILISLFSIYIYILHDEKDYNASLLSLGILFFTPSLLIFLSLPFKMKLNLHPTIFLSMVVAFIISFAIYLISKAFKSIYHNFLNTSLIFSHSLDGFTTWMVASKQFNIGVTYGEKHPIPSILLKYGISYPILKLAVILLIIYSIEELKPNLKNTIKWLILFLGLAPGLRDFLRILIGV